MNKKDREALQALRTDWQEVQSALRSAAFSAPENMPFHLGRITKAADNGLRQLDHLLTENSTDG